MVQVKDIFVKKDINIKSVIKNYIVSKGVF